MFYLLDFYLSISLEIRKKKSKISFTIFFDTLGDAFFDRSIVPQRIIAASLGKSVDIAQKQ